MFEVLYSSNELAVVMALNDAGEVTDVACHSYCEPQCERHLNCEGDENECYIQGNTCEFIGDKPCDVSTFRCGFDSAFGIMVKRMRK